MKTLILASAAALTLGFGSAFAVTTEATQQNQQQIAINGQPSDPYYGQSSNAPANTAHVGGWEPVPSNSMSGGD